jgi:hypothetical protein
VCYSTESFETTCEIQNRSWSEEVAVILTWISLGRFATFDAAKKREIEAYVLENSKESGSGRSFREKEVILVVPPLPT